MFSNYHHPEIREFSPPFTTLNRIWLHNPCQLGWQRALKAANKRLPDDEPILYSEMVNAVEMEDVLWCCHVEKKYSRLWHRYAIWCARQVQHLMVDERSIAALDVAERYVNDQATNEELDAAADAVEGALWDLKWREAPPIQGSIVVTDAAIDATRAARNAIKCYFNPTRAFIDAIWAIAYSSSPYFPSDPDRMKFFDVHWDRARDSLRKGFIQLVTTGTLPLT